MRLPVLCNGQRGVVDERKPLVVSLYSYPGRLGGRPLLNTRVGAEEVVVKHHQAYQRGVLNLEAPDCLEPIPELSVEPLVAVVVIELRHDP